MLLIVMIRDNSAVISSTAVKDKVNSSNCKFAGQSDVLMEISFE